MAIHINTESSRYDFEILYPPVRGFFRMPARIFLAFDIY